MSSTGNQGFGVAAVRVNVSELESMLAASPSAERVCVKLAQILRVRRSEVALLRLDKGSLRFLFPTELRAAGVLPLNGSAVAARTAATRTALLSNAFMRVRHVSLFEAVKLGSAEEEDRSLDQMPIQKIISVPVANSEGHVMGVVQISRKGPDASGAGADFTTEDLKQLEQAAEIVARMPFMQEGAGISPAI
jgi:GAF domain